MFEYIFKDCSDLNLIKEALYKKQSIKLNGCVPSQLEHFISCAGEGFRHKLIITHDELKAAQMAANYAAFDENAVFYPAEDPLFHEACLQGNFISEQRLETARMLYEKEPLCVVTTKQAFTDRLRSFGSIKKESISVRPGDETDLEKLAQKLVRLGYEREDTVTAKGEFAIRGNIVDIFPYTEVSPLRLDLWGDEVESIKRFDAESQRSFEAADELNVFAGGDAFEEDEEWADFLEYFSKEDTLIVLDEPDKFLGKDDLYLIKKTEGYARLLSSMLGAGFEYIRPEYSFNINTKNIASYNGRFNDLVSDLIGYRKKGYETVICAASEMRAESLRSQLLEAGISANVIFGNIKTGFEYPDLRFALISEIDIYGNRKRRKRKRRYSGDPLKAFSDLHTGDLVVHEQHGIGRYLGIERLTSDGVEKDYMKIEYANNAYLYVLASQFDKIQKYAGPGQTQPKLSRLGGKEWINTKTKVKAQVDDIAKDLVRLYAQRQKTPGFKYSPDTVWQREFEDEFEFEETADQLEAIEAVKRDMESGHIMDRLICGDVGFGKTEVAIRAAFKAVQDGKQVAFLCPTTILASQHYKTITRRMSNYPVNVRLMSRFVSAGEQTKTIKELKSGMADIVVGTHRLLSNDIVFKDLGLLIVDEEQRFGVAHKEKIKQLKNNVDVLTLSATPIPRTLHMSLSGIRDMSLLTEPPVDRVPIQTYVMEYDPEVVKEAVMREVSRGGQVYYLYNRTADIDRVAGQISDMLPGIRVEYAHGKMPARDIEDIMEAFTGGAVDVLVSTTIIETGLDIPNVNTIMIQDADNFGLAQLYQLRGRVGRSNRTAYAFLLYRKDKLVREVAEKRLKAIREFSDLGSGVKIAMRDLEIRGAGNILGAQQSGHMGEVGYELYCKMLNEAVALLKGQEVPEDFETAVDLDMDAYIPSSYIGNESDKLDIYKKISAIVTDEDADDMVLELKDRFGPVPEVTKNLIMAALIKSKAHALYITEISQRGAEFKMTMYENARIDTYKMHGFLKKYADMIRFSTGKRPYFIYSPKKEAKKPEEIQKAIFGFFTRLEEITL